MAAPTFSSSGSTTYNDSATPKTSSVTVTNGDVLVVVVSSEDQSTAVDAPTGGGLTYTLQQTVFVSANTTAYLYTAPSTGAQTFSLSVAKSGAGSGWWGFTWLRFTATAGVGASGVANTTGAPSLALTTLFANSAIAALNADWNAIAGARTWRTVNSVTPTAGNGGERLYFTDPAHYSVGVAFWSDAGAAGSKTVGLTAPGAQKYSLVAVEVRGVAGATNFTQANTEAAGITDAVSRVTATIADPIVDAGGLTDSRLQVSTAVQSFTETGGLLDDASYVHTPGGGGTPDFTDLIGALDIFNQVVTNVRTNPEALGITDAVAQEVAATRSLTEAAGLTDSLTAQVGETVTYNEVRLFDANPAPDFPFFDAELNVGLRFYTYTIGAYLTAVWWYRPNGAPASIPLRVFDPTGALVVSWTGNAPTVNAWNRIDLITPQLIAVVADYWTVSAHTQWYGYFANQFAANVWDPPLYADGNPGANNEPFVYTTDPNVMPPQSSASGNGYGLDVSIGTRVLAPYTLTDPAGLTDSQLIFNGQEEAAGDGVGITDAETHVVNYVRIIDDVDVPPTTFSDPIVATDTLAITTGTTRPITDAANLLDTAARLAAAIRTNTDAMAMTDSMTGLLNSSGFNVTISDTIGAVDGQAKVNAQFRSIVDNLGMVDNLDGAGSGDIFYFTPPVHASRPLAYAVAGNADEPFVHFAEGGIGVNVWKLLNGSYTQSQPLDMSTVAHEYLGGHVHPVSAAERASLIAAGYGSYVT